jgi:DeoR family fructose operon transcriptional repressor
MYPHERREKIIETLRKVGRIDVLKDAKLLGISSSTLHRDLAELEKLGHLKKLRGGAILVDGPQIHSRFNIRLGENVKKKEKIAQNAIKKIKDDTSIFLDHSSTVFYLAREIKHSNYKNLIILTNSLAIPFELSPEIGVKIIMLGGVVEHEFRALSGRLLMETIRNFNLHQAFVSVAAISAEKGLMTQALFIQEFLPKLFSHANEINILADSSKFQKIGALQIVPLNSAMKVFSDNELSDSVQSELLQHVSEIII